MALFLIITLLALAEVLVSINRFCTFLQTLNLNYALIIDKFKRLFSLLEKIGEPLPHHESSDRNLKYFSNAKERLSFAKESSDLSPQNRPANNSE